MFTLNNKYSQGRSMLSRGNHNLRVNVLKSTNAMSRWVSACRGDEEQAFIYADFLVTQNFLYNFMQK